MKQIRTLYIAYVFLCLIAPECCSREATATAISGIKDSGAFICDSSYYTVESCLAESGQATMANGKALNDNEYTFASWDFRLGERAKIRNLRNNREVVAVCTDRGPAKRLYSKGRRIDLSLAAFKQIADIKEGVVKVSVEVVKLVKKGR